MGRTSQKKGRRNEIALARLLRSLGHDVRVHGLWEEWDLTVDGQPVEVKTRKNGYRLFYSLAEQGITTVYCRQDRKPWLKFTVEVLHDKVSKGKNSTPERDDED